MKYRFRVLQQDVPRTAIEKWWPCETPGPYRLAKVRASVVCEVAWVLVVKSCCLVSDNSVTILDDYTLLPLQQGGGPFPLSFRPLFLLYPCEEEKYKALGRWMGQKDAIWAEQMDLM